MTSAVPFSIYFAGDAYSTANKIMGRQSAGRAFMRGVARTWPDEMVHGTGQGRPAGEAMLRQLQGDGFKGQLRWSELGDWSSLAEVGCMYYPSPASKDLAASRNSYDPAAFSMMGVTFTLSSNGATDQVADLILPPFKPWDAMICISKAALDFSTGLHDEMKAWWTAQTGATRYNTPQLPVIPLGIDCPSFTPQPGQRAKARAALGLDGDAVAYLFAGRLSFHAKGNPAPMYQALEKVAQQKPVVCIEAGVFPNDEIRKGFMAAHQALAPSVRFIWVDGNDEQAYRQAWQGADVFVSLSDNIQETFGLTPVEAMAAGLPVVVSDWNGYKETVRDGIDGFRVPTILPPAGMGGDLAARHALGIDSYDYYIGRASMATVTDPVALAAALGKLARDPALRTSMGAAAQAHAHAEFDWPVILRRYAQLSLELGGLRAAAGPQAAEPWVQRADPFSRFRHFPSATIQGNWLVVAAHDAPARLNDMAGLAMANYAFDAAMLPRATIEAVLATSVKLGEQNVNALLAAAGTATPVGVRALMWLWKFDLLRARPA
ncbi:glycosyltransferase family 4 protein [Pseudoduganella sp. LjRoot289]|uniref:glycosyltransferase family 4 protein n=1 Tax=Pseudoduganella sp. LjRoot289 TaxID=3342314 RepID=UPI003ECE1779